MTMSSETSSDADVAADADTRSEAATSNEPTEATETVPPPTGDEPISIDAPALPRRTPSAPLTSTRLDTPTIPSLLSTSIEPPDTDTSPPNVPLP